MSGKWSNDASAGGESAQIVAVAVLESLAGQWRREAQVLRVSAPGQPTMGAAWGCHERALMCEMFADRAAEFAAGLSDEDIASLTR